MFEKINIHASCVEINGAGILILGEPGSGKSDLCLRLIRHGGAKLVADDRTDLWLEKAGLYAAAPQILQGLLEVRGWGIVPMPFAPCSGIKLAVQLAPSWEEIERFPQAEFLSQNHLDAACDGTSALKDLEELKIPLFKSYAFEPSAADKICIILRQAIFGKVVPSGETVIK